MAAGLCAINLAIYSGVGQHQFIDLDDAAYIYQNPHVAGGLSWDAVAWALGTGYLTYWHPLTWMSHMLDVQLFGMKAGPHHLVSLLFHMLSTLLLFGALRGMTGEAGRSAFVAALFAAHPLHVESVAWAAERKDVLSTFFWMAAICAYGWYVRRPGAVRYAAVTALFVLGLMSKPMLVTLPFTLLLLDYWPLGRVAAGGGIKAAAPRLVLEKLPLFLLSAIASAITFIAQKQVGAVTGLDAAGPLLRVTHALVAYTVYLGKTLWPVDLAPFYHYTKVLPVWMVGGSAAVLTGISAVAIRASRTRPYLAVGWFWFVGTLVPVIGLVQAGQQAWADRFMYVPLIGLAIIASWGGYDLLSGLSLAGARVPAAAAVLLALMVAAHAQAGYWQDSYTIWSHAAEVTSDNQVAEISLGTVLRDSGRFDDAVAHFNRALRIEPDSLDAHINLGLALVQEGRPADAISQYRAAIGIDPDSSIAHGDLGLALIRTGETGEASRELDQALKLDPGNRTAEEGREYLAKYRR